MSIDININFKADDRLIESLNMLSGWLFALYHDAGMAAIQGCKVPDAKALAAKIDAREKAKEAKKKDAKSKPEKKDDAKLGSENPDETVSGDNLVKLRAKVMEFGKADSTGENRDKLSAWLKAHGLQKVPDATNAQAAELISYISKEEAKTDAG